MMLLCKTRGLAIVALTMASVLLLTGSGGAADQPGRFVDLPNVRLWITDSGGPGDVVVLLHPTTGTSAIWQDVVPLFVDAGFRVLAPDKPGWGKSVVRTGQEPISLTENLDLLLDRLGVAQINLVGVANGGYAALDFAAWRPERVRKLVIAASGLGVKGDAEGEAFRKRAAIPNFASLPPEVREMSPSYRGLHPDRVAAWKAIEENAKQAGAVEPPLRTPNTIDKLTALKVPLLILAGDVDLTTPSGAIRLWTRHLKEPYQWVLIPEAGHALAWEQPAVFSRTVISFLNEQ